MHPADFGRYSEDYAAYRPLVPASVYERLNTIIRIGGSRSLDLATGPGTIALELGARGSAVVGIDTSEELIATATRIAAERNLESGVRFTVARAEHTGLAGSSFDLVTAGQCWHWFDGDAVLAEVQRVLRPGGVLAIVYYSYLAEHSAVAHDTEDLILEFNPSWTMSGSKGVFPRLMDDVVHAGFRLVEQFCYDQGEMFSHMRWRGRMRTSSGMGAAGLPPSEVQRFGEALRRLLDEKYPDPVEVEHRVWCVVARKPS
jgi:ubiquinone/menaquinone biosynthesis C-methylase UbiE